MSNSGNSFKNEEIREIAATSITTSYANLGSPISHRAYRITIMNDTNGDVYIRRSTDPAGVDTRRIAAQQGRILDDKTNDAVEGNGVQYTIKWAGSAPGAPAGTFWVEVEYV